METKNFVVELIGDEIKHVKETDFSAMDSGSGYRKGTRILRKEGYRSIPGYESDRTVKVDYTYEVFESPVYENTPNTYRNFILFSLRGENMKSIDPRELRRFFEVKSSEVIHSRTPQQNAYNAAMADAYFADRD